MKEFRLSCLVSDMSMIMLARMIVMIPVARNDNNVEQVGNGMDIGQC